MNIIDNLKIIYILKRFINVNYLKKKSVDAGGYNLGFYSIIVVD